jgi:hypothetical protein
MVAQEWHEAYTTPTCAKQTSVIINSLRSPTKAMMKPARCVAARGGAEAIGAWVLTRETVSRGTSGGPNAWKA